MRLFFSIFIIFLLVACERELIDQPSNALMNVPLGFPEPVFPADNELTPERWALGKRLFYDPILSVDGTVSCASCHAQDLGFTDGKKFSEGVEGRSGHRNAPTLANVAYHPYYTREGGVPTLEMQILVPVQEHVEFDFNILSIVDRLKADTSYVAASWEAYGREPDAFVITRAIACFERTILSGNSRYDLFLNGNQSALSEKELNGKDLFFSSRLNCSSCHVGFNFTNYAFENNGLYEEYPDAGRFRLTEKEEDIALFKVPTLRNIAVTAPYMHDGSVATLEEVIEHYNSGGKLHPHKSNLVKPLDLSAQEKSDLIAFLESLTDNDFLNDAKFRE